jgi:hypothetical protein
MKTTSLISHLTFGYSQTIKPEVKKELNSEALKFQNQNDKLDFQDFAKELKIKFPEFQVLHDCHVRSQINKIETHLKTIKSIILIYFILSIVAGIIVALSMA